MIGHQNQQVIGQRKAIPMSEINTTPLVDVMLVLLVIFIMTAPLLSNAVKINLPQVSSQPVIEKPQTVTISIDGAGQFYWNDTAYTQADIKQKLKMLGQSTPQAELQIRADQDTRYALLAEVMADAQQAGVSKLGFVSMPKGESSKR